MKSVVVLPTYNERENIGPLIGEIYSLLPEISILVVDDNSPDGTAGEVENLTMKYPNLSLLKRPEKNGLGGAYIAAFKKLLMGPDVRNIIMMDADFSHNPKYLTELLRESENYDLVIGSRYIKGGGIEKWELWRRLLSWFGNLYVRILLRKNVSDWTTGYNCINAYVLRKINLDKIDLSGYAFIMGVKYFLIEAGASVKEVPIIFEARRGGESKMSGHIIREGILTPWKLLFTK
ncbi:MAG: polyprenol monophosphomannose synthase [Parcubacteria group bacterium]|nr:polyprenol monophosphomannose synthase [Parcubacteria group bacterium]